MKPIKLTIAGINSFIEEQTLDFEAAGRSNLFCICGKTGAGKTTIFDSIMLALYGKSPKGNLADVINLSLNTARVALDFSEDGEVYTVERVIKCKTDKDGKRGTASTDCTLYKNGVPISVKSDDINQIIYGIIGLEAAEFKNVYLLEQGEYAEFLKKTPQKQTEAVGKIFSLMRFGDVFHSASERERELSRDVAARERELDKLGDVSPQMVKEQKDELKALKTKLALLEKDVVSRAAELVESEKIRDIFIRVREKQNAVKTLMIQSDEAKKREYNAKVALEEFEKTVDPQDAKTQELLRERLNKLAALNTLDREYAAAERDVAAKKEALNKKNSNLEQAEMRLAELKQTHASFATGLKELAQKFIYAANGVANKSAGLEFAVCSLSGDISVAGIVESKQKLIAELDKFSQLNDARQKISGKIAADSESKAKQLDVIENYTRRLAELEQNAQSAQAEVNRAAQALSAAQLHSHAAAVRAELHAGDVCPVCGGKYDGTHEIGDTDVERAKAELEKANNRLKEIEKARTECNKHCDRAKADYDNLDKSILSAERELQDAERKMQETCVVPDVYKVLTEILDECKRTAEKEKQASDMLIKHTPILSALSAECNALKDALSERQNKSENYKAELGEHCGKTDGEIKSAKDELAQVDARLSASEAKRKQLTGEVQAQEAAVAAIEQSLAAAKSDCPVDSPEFDESAYAEKRDGLERLKNQAADINKDIAVKQVGIDALTQKCAELAELKAELAELKKRADLYRVIADITKNKAMLNFVATEYIVEFTEIAGEILGELSSGKYAMRYDKNNGFMVSDYLNGGKFRKTDTLSGGELFLASLSVAIAIARTQSRGNNAFFFLDEGFGTLDEDLIDVVYGALESLSRDCLVGVITHAEALIARMPFTVTVQEATDTCGSRIQN
ncbi:MAG: SMC family ATPase [Clostridiales bacterium]|nr:SMC family ATPase [Clostridiales bacterium]